MQLEQLNTPDSCHILETLIVMIAATRANLHGVKTDKSMGVFHQVREEFEKAVITRAAVDTAAGVESISTDELADMAGEIIKVDLRKYLEAQTKNHPSTQAAKHNPSNN